MKTRHWFLMLVLLAGLLPPLMSSASAGRLIPEEVSSDSGLLPQSDFQAQNYGVLDQAKSDFTIRSISPDSSIIPTDWPVLEGAEVGSEGLTLAGGGNGFEYVDFSTPTGLVLIGTATQLDDFIRLNPSTHYQTGAVWHSAKQFVQDGFESTFLFRISDVTQRGADGFSFVIQNDQGEALGGSGGALGYTFIHNSIAIEFDTWRNKEIGDPNDNHLSIQTRGTEANDSDHAFSLACATDIPALSDGVIHTATVRYVPGLIEVYLDDSETPVTSTALWLTETLTLDYGRAWVGFTGSSGGSVENHDILSWSLRTRLLPTLAMQEEPNIRALTAEAPEQRHIYSASLEELPIGSNPLPSMHESFGDYGRNYSLPPVSIPRTERTHPHTLPDVNPAPIQPRAAIVWTVNSQADSGPGTLREALLNAQSGDTVRFDTIVFPPTQPMTITLTTSLPALTQGHLTIDASDAGVVLDGQNLADGHGFYITSNDNIIRGLQIIRFPWGGIELAEGAQNNLIGGDWTVGSAPRGEGNIITLNGESGVMIRGAGTMSNTVSGNLIGLDANGAPDFRIQALVISPDYAQDQTLFVGTRYYGVWKSADGGSHWSPANSGLTDFNITALVISPAYVTDHTLFAGAAGGGIFKTINAGASWQRVDGNLASNWPIRTLAISPDYANDQTVFAVVSNVGLFATTDGGLSWQNRSTNTALGSAAWDLRGFAVSPAYTDDQRVLTFTWNHIFGSDDGGVTWSLLTDEVYDPRVIVFSSEYAYDHTIIAGRAGCDANNPTEVFWRSTDGGVTWSVIGGQLSICIPSTIVFSPDYATDQTIFVSDEWGGLYRSTDIGDSWSKVLTGTANLVVFSPAHAEDQTLFTSQYPGEIMSSNDSGNQWHSTGANLTERGNAGEGVAIRDGAKGNIIGGTQPGQRNVISHNVWAGILIADTGTNHNQIVGNYIGTDGSGTLPLGNQTEGIAILLGAACNQVGGATSGTRNVIGANSVGVSIRDSGTVSNTVQGNYIGVDASGLVRLANRGNGIELHNGAQYNLVGGSTAAARNVVSGNGETGIGVWGSYSNTVASNYVGLAANGTVALSNQGNGVALGNAFFNRIESNVISNNRGHGLGIWEYAAHNVAMGNIIGLDANGQIARGNGASGVILGYGAHENLIGGSATGERNIISGNTWSGVYVGGNPGEADVSNNQIAGNYLGLDVSGEKAVGNGNGVILRGTAKLNLIGGTTTAEGNLITGNQNYGVQIYDSTAMSNTISGNRIGLYATETRDFRVRALAISPTYAQDRTLFIGAHYDGVWKTTNGGTTWTQMVGLPISTVTALAVSPAYNTDKTVLAGDNNGVLFKSTNGGATWFRIDRDIAEGNKITAIVFSPAYAYDQQIFVLAEYSGIFVSADGGYTWQVRHHGLENNIGYLSGLILSTDYLADHTLFTYGWDRIYKSTDSGISWITATMQIEGIQTLAIAPNFASESTLLVGINACGTEDVRFWKSVDGGQTFAALPNTPNQTPCHIRSVAFSPNYAVDATLFAGDDWSGVYRSQNGGLTWQRVAAGHFNRSLVVSPAYTQDRTVWVGRYNGEMLLSANGGDNWNPVGATLTRPGNYNDGIMISQGAHGNLIGGDTPGERNIISNNGSAGVRITDVGTQLNVVSGNYIGTNAAGVASLGNDTEGVAILNGAQWNLVGGASVGERNIIGGNEAGVLVHASGTTNNVVVGNYIGVDVSGVQVLGNRGDGVNLASGTQNNRIGGSIPGERNVISGNEMHGIGIWHSGTTSNTVLGNYIGVDSAGSVALGNSGGGIYIGEGASHNQIGSTITGARNIISGNQEHGIGIWNVGTEFNTVIGNYIGVDATGAQRLGNGASGIGFDHGARHNRVGGTTTAERNVISDNRWDGISLWNAETMSNTITGNYIGISASGLVGLSNQGSGIGIYEARSNTIGGTTTGMRNVISGNLDGGITLSGVDTAYNAIVGNYLGLTAMGNTALSNRHGISCVWQAHHNTIANNFIGGNTYDGISLNSCDNNIITGNFIGTNIADAHLGNGENGINLFSDAQDNILGPGNVIAHNQQQGIGISDTSIRNTITRNLIYQNRKQAIKLSRGGNNELPAPTLITQTTTTVQGRASDGHQTLEIYAGDSLGRWIYMGTTSADARGYFTYTQPSGFISNVLLATATDTEGNTSEFSDLAICASGELCNGGFEPDLDDWVIEGLAEQVTPGLRSIYAVRSVQNLGASQPAAWAGLQQTLTVTGGQGYVFQGWLKWQDVAQLHMEVQWLDAAGQAITNTIMLAPRYGDSGDWEKYTFSMVAPTHAARGRLLLRHGLSQQGINISSSTVWLDNLSFAPMPFATGYAISTPTIPTTVTTWLAYTLTVELPPGTAMAASVLDVDQNPLPGLINIPLQTGEQTINLVDINPLQYPALQLQLHLTSTLAGVSPVLTHWRVDWVGNRNGDGYEPDDTCALARTMATDGTPQLHTFHQYGDSDWIHFEGLATSTYIIQAMGDAPFLDLQLELYDSCSHIPLDLYDLDLGPNARLRWTAPVTGTYYVRVANNDPTIFGSEITYTLSVRQTSPMGAAIIVAGRNDAGTVQANINFAADYAAQVLLEAGLARHDLYYLRPTLQPGGTVPPDAVSSSAQLQAAIQTWATSRIGPDRPLYLYLVDHGGVDRFFVFGNADTLTPATLDTWLDSLESTCNCTVVIIIEACRSGSFIDTSQNGLEELSKPGRIIITSTSANRNAFALPGRGAYFSDPFFTALAGGADLWTGFQAGVAAVRVHGLWQIPWLDDNGNATPHTGDANDGALARQLGLYGLALGGVAPHITSASGPTEIASGRGTVRAQVTDDTGVDFVWALVYPPSFMEPDNPNGETLELNLDSFILLDGDGDGEYVGNYGSFSETGEYRVVIYAKDTEDNLSPPVALLVQNGWAMYLPLLTRSYRQVQQ